MSSQKKILADNVDFTQLKETVSWNTACTKLSILNSSKKAEDQVSKEWIFQMALAIMEVVKIKTASADPSRLRALAVTRLIPRDAVERTLFAANILNTEDTVSENMIKMLKTYSSSNSWLFSEQEDSVAKTPGTVDDCSPGMDSHFTQPLPSDEDNLDKLRDDEQSMVIGTEMSDAMVARNCFDSQQADAQNAMEIDETIVNSPEEQMVWVLRKPPCAECIRRKIPCVRKDSRIRTVCVQCAKSRQGACSIYQPKPKSMRVSEAKAEGYLILTDDKKRVVWAPDGGEITEIGTLPPIHLNPLSGNGERDPPLDNVNPFEIGSRDTMGPMHAEGVSEILTIEDEMMALEISDSRVENYMSSSDIEDSEQLLNERYKSFLYQIEDKSIKEQGELFAKLILEMHEDLSIQKEKSRMLLKSAMKNFSTGHVQKVIERQDLEQAYLSLADDCARHFISCIRQNGNRSEMKL